MQVNLARRPACNSGAAQRSEVDDEKYSRPDQIIEDAPDKHGPEVISVYESGFRVFVLKPSISTMHTNSRTTTEEPIAIYLRRRARRCPLPAHCDAQQRLGLR